LTIDVCVEGLPNLRGHRPSLIYPSKPFETMQTIESYRGEIFRLYIVLNKTASEVIAILKRDYNFDVS
jgi:hypothetical protein